MTILTIGKRFVPVEQIAFVEPFDPSANPEFKPEKDFKSRIVLVNRDTVLTEMTAQQFAEDHSFKYLAEDEVALNGGVVFFWVEAFAPTEDFRPQKPYQSRLKWRAPDGREQSKLLVTEPVVVAVIVANPLAASNPPQKQAHLRAPRRPARPRKSREVEAATKG